MKILEKLNERYGRAWSDKPFRILVATLSLVVGYTIFADFLHTLNLITARVAYIPVSLTIISFFVLAPTILVALGLSEIYYILRGE